MNALSNILFDLVTTRDTFYQSVCIRYSFSREYGLFYLKRQLTMWSEFKYTYSKIVFATLFLSISGEDIQAQCMKRGQCLVRSTQIRVLVTDIERSAI